MDKVKRLKKDLGDHKVVGLDTGVFIHHFGGDELSELTSVVLGQVQDGHVRGTVSTVTLAEVMARPLELGLESLADLYRVLFHEMPNLELVAMDPAVAARAAGIRSMGKLEMASSILLASAAEAGASAFVTDDPELTGFNGMKVMVLDEYL
ncbi:MAG: type II toxin-antitoxin system VapC family toxin [Actinobacteria bacterium]|nr:type II toxin-antitoxin system VapC family toxin [Actinomycetota bacterium]MBU1942617.1 type II toxin-antitoxin system VapC family toxin [Actinomycetota bacterium]MBU2688707.1 type II toxin-antitoxin system VapC family toxin [Actinomycetota bacterium]